MKLIHRTKQQTDEEGPGISPDFIVGRVDNLSNADENLAPKNSRGLLSFDVSQTRSLPLCTGISAQGAED